MKKLSPSTIMQEMSTTCDMCIRMILRKLALKIFQRREMNLHHKLLLSSCLVEFHLSIHTLDNDATSIFSLSLHQVKLDQKKVFEYILQAFPIDG